MGFSDLLPSGATLLSAYASVSTLAMISRTVKHDFIPKRLSNFITAKLTSSFANYFSFYSTITIEERWHGFENPIFKAVSIYLSTVAGPSDRNLLLGSNDTNSITAPPKRGIPVYGDVIDKFHGKSFEWSLYEKEVIMHRPREKYYELTFNKKDGAFVNDCYMPHIQKTAESIKNKRESLEICAYDKEDRLWDNIIFKHPATFDTLAMDPDLKKMILEDLDSFVNGKDFFRRVGRAWKRGYLLYGPPGTGKSTLVAAIANHLKYNIFDIQLQSISNDAELRNILTSTDDRSILLIEDIDCASKSLHSRVPDKKPKLDGEDDNNDKDLKDPSGVTLSGLLNFIDGIWSGCGQERLIIFTTNYKERLDPALLRPGRMDVHIYMGYCSPVVFKQLAFSYLRVENHELFECIEDLIQRTEVTPAEVAQQLMNRKNSQVALGCLLEFLNKKVNEAGKTNEAETDEVKQPRKEKDEEDDATVEKTRPNKPRKKPRRRPKN